MFSQWSLFERPSENIGDLDKHFFTEETITQFQKEAASETFFSQRKSNPATPLPSQPGLRDEDGNGQQSIFLKEKKPVKSFWLENLPNIKLRCDPLVNFKVKQKLKLLGACVTLGLDYLSDIAQWRTYCSVEDSLVKGRFSLRGSELGWAKSWQPNLGLGEENSAKFKLRLGLNLNNYKFYAKLRFRTEPISPFDITDGLSCAGKLPLPVYMLPLLRKVPLRVEYKLRINAARSSDSLRGKSEQQERKVHMTTGLGTIDVSLDELNVCLEYDEYSPLWGLGIVKTERKRSPRLSQPSRSQRPFHSYSPSPPSNSMK
eukprot:gene14064-15539_t